MNLICDPHASNNNPSTKIRKNVKKKLPREICKYMASEVICGSSEKRCSCCGGFACAPRPCSVTEAPKQIWSPISEKESVSCKTESHEETKIPCKCIAELCWRKSSWASFEDRLEDESEYSENEINNFIKIIRQKLRDSLDQGGELLVRGNNLYGLRDSCGVSLENNAYEASFARDVCVPSSTCVSLETTLTNDLWKTWVQCGSKDEVRYPQHVDEENVEQSKKPGKKQVQNTCESSKLVILRHEMRYQEYPHVVKGGKDVKTRLAKLDFEIGDVGRSEETSRWGELDIVDRLLAERMTSLERSQINNNDVFCETKDKFDKLDRFSCLDRKDLTTLCRQLFRWSYRLSKKWRAFVSQPHVVIHLPSLGFPSTIRRRASRSFNFLQNIQVTRLGWLANENAQVLYISPGNQSIEMITLFRDLIKNVRPDVNENRLWIVQTDGKECLKTESLNGSRALYQNSKTYRRVRMLTAGRQAFILPGIMEEIDVLIASELRAPIMGPPIEFQNYFLNKSNVANFLKNINVDQPPFVPDLHHFSELCQKLARLMMEFPNYVKWLIKINYGFNGIQTASITFEKNSSREMIGVKKSPCQTAETELTVFLMEILPMKIIFNKQAYKSCTEFFCDLEKYGGLVQACPYVNYRVLSLGVFLQDDTTTPEICTSADVFHIPYDITTDLVYGIPQATTPRLPLENLTVKVGIALREYQYIGYFGLDVVTFEDEDSKEKFFIVDIDPHYTDVIAFTDWVRFCLKVTSHQCQCCQSRVSGERENGDRVEMNMKNMKKSNLYRRRIDNSEDTMKRYAICSGKLYSNGLTKYRGSTLVSLCEERNLRYNSKIKQGSMICPIDSERRALGLISLHSERSRAIDEFAKGLRVLHELSLEKHNEKITTNMLVSYRPFFGCLTEMLRPMPIRCTELQRSALDF